MLERLPTELVLVVFCEAAEIFVATAEYRSSATSLALTIRLAYNTIRPILLRRVIITDSNMAAVIYLLQQPDSAAMILELNLASNMWTEPSSIFRHLTNIQCLRGIADPIESVIAGLPQFGLASLFKLQLWDVAPLSVVPPSITHICLYTDELSIPPLQPFINWINAVPSITHVGCEFVAKHNEDMLGFKSEDLQDGLRTFFEASGSHLVTLAIRTYGVLTLPDIWERYLEVFRSVNEGVGIGRLCLWRDCRPFLRWEDDVATSLSDARAGTDVWTEARPLDAFV